MYTENNKSSWAQKTEKGNKLVLNLSRMIIQYFPSWLINICVYIVVSYYYLICNEEKKYIKQYQQNLKNKYRDCKIPKYFPIFNHFLSFGNAICDKFAVWQKKITYPDLIIEDRDNIYKEIKNSNVNRGQIFICSHLGNVEISRSLVSHNKNFMLNILVYNEHAIKFNEAIQQAGADYINLISVKNLDSHTMITLYNKIENGEWIAIAADRTPVKGEKIHYIDFLGHKAPLSQGPWLLAGLLKTKVNLLFCIKKNKKYHLNLKKFTDKISWNKNNRNDILKNIMQKYSNILEQECRENPIQWFNFYNFWGK